MTVAPTETTISDLSPLLAATSHRPWQGYVVFDHSQRIIRVSSSLSAVFAASGQTGPDAKNLMELLSYALGPGQATIDSVMEWLNRSIELAPEVIVSTLDLQTANKARIVRARLDRIGEQYWIVNFEDVTSAFAESERRGPAYEDRLTGIGNRARFEHSLDRAIACLHAGEAQSATVLFVDLDRFKAVNDTLGHAVGDTLLRLVSERLQSSIRHSDTLARLGGDEFAILLDQASPLNFVSALAARMIDLVQRPYLIDGQVVNVGASIGIAVAPADGTTRIQLLKSADLALYHSKSAGRGVFHFFQAEMEAKAQRRRNLELDLRKALPLRQFMLHYQPQIEAETQTMVALEGLLRWQHPQRGLLLPAEFLPLAEEIGLGVAIGDWVLKTACKEAVRWPDSVTIAVNISSIHFELGKFAGSVERALKNANIPGRRLEVEVTEDILLRDGETVLATLNALRGMGLRVSMDSFGTGLASLSQLVNFPFDKIKLDRSLMDDQHDSPKHRAIVRAISALGQSLGISTLAEGVKTSEELAHARLEGCESLQGFYYKQAVPASELGGLFPTFFPAGIRQLSNKGDA